MPQQLRASSSRNELCRDRMKDGSSRIWFERTSSKAWRHVAEFRPKGGKRLGRERLNIVTAISEIYGPFDFDMVLARARSVDPVLSRTTIYETLRMLKQEGLICTSACNHGLDARWFAQNEQRVPRFRETDTASIRTLERR